MQKTIEFYKYQGTGNDFIMIDNRNDIFPKTTETIRFLCDRRFGIGGDGLILLENDSEADFRMVYFNSDGNQSTMCGNGGRCLVSFAHFLNLFKTNTTFIAIDGLHEASIESNQVKLKMIDVPTIKVVENAFELNTGSPHYVEFVQELKNYKVFENGNKIRNSASYLAEGINVNFVEELSENEIFVRTYERGVEDETYSCGTGATASALVYMKNKNLQEVKVDVLGGELKVCAEKSKNGFKNIWLQGPAKQIFKGEINL